MVLTMTNRNVLRLIAKQLQVFDGVVGGVSVDVVHDLFGQQVAPKVLLHHIPMFEDVLQPVRLDV